RPPMSISEERSDRVLVNGARLYNDHGHPEYATPECSNLKDLVAHDRAGERIVWECALARMQSAGGGRHVAAAEDNSQRSTLNPPTTHHSPLTTHRAFRSTKTTPTTMAPATGRTSVISCGATCRRTRSSRDCCLSS